MVQRRQKAVTSGWWGAICSCRRLGNSHCSAPAPAVCYVNALQHVLRIAAGCRPQFLGETEEEEDLGPQRDCVLKLEHVPKLLSLFGVHSEETAANGSCSNPSHPAGGNRLSPISPFASGLVSAVRGFPAAAFVSPPESLSLALRVLLPALYSRRLTPQDLRALLTPLVDIPNLKEMVLHAKETAPQSRLALLPDAVAHVILEAPATARDGLQYVQCTPPSLRLLICLLCPRSCACCVCIFLCVYSSLFLLLALLVFLLPVP